MRSTIIVVDPSLFSLWCKIMAYYKVVVNGFDLQMTIEGNDSLKDVCFTSEEVLKAQAGICISHCLELVQGHNLKSICPLLQNVKLFVREKNKDILLKEWTGHEFNK